MSTPKIPTVVIDVDAAPRPRRNDRTPPRLLAAAFFQFIVLGWMIGDGLMVTATRATSGYVQVVPIDPRDLFTGEYVALSYPFGSVPPEGIAGLPRRFERGEFEPWRDRAVYVELIPDPARPDHFRGGPPSLTPPADGTLHLRGKLASPSRIEFGIERFHVREGEGRAFETAAREHKLWARIDVTGQGRAMVTGLAIE